MNEAGIFRWVTTGAVWVAMVVSPAWAQTMEPLALAPFTGAAGYQEIQLEGDNWYLAFHGTRKHSIEQVRTGWWARAAQLCESARKPFIVELRYVGDPVYADEKMARYDDGFRAIPVAGPIYITMFIPSGPRNIPPTLTPTKAAVLRCVDLNTGLRTGRKAVTLAEAKEEARKGGMTVP